MKLKSILLFIFFFLPALAFAKAPAWVLMPAKTYPANKFIAQTGSGESQTEAKADALNSISQYFNTEFKGEVAVNFSSTESDGEFSQSHTTEESKKISTSVTLQGLEFSEFYFDKKENRYYVCAFLNRSKIWGLYESEIKSFAKNFDIAISNAVSLENENPLEAIRIYTGIKSSSESKIKLLKFLYLICDEASDLKIYENQFYSLDVKIANIASSCPIVLFIQGDYENSIQTALNEILSKIGFTIVNSEDDAYFILNAEIETNDNDSNQKLYLIYPAINLEIVDAETDKSLWSFSAKCGKCAGSSKNASYKSGFKKLSAELENKFISNFAVSFGG